MVVILPDSGSRYLSKVYDDGWMRENGFLEQVWSDIRAGNIQAMKPKIDLQVAHPDDRLRDVVGVLKEHSVSQLPVVDDNGHLHGMVTEIDLLNHMLTPGHVHDPDETIRAIIDHDVPAVGPNAGLETLMAIFTEQPAVIIIDDGRVQGILTKIDILDYLSSQMR